MSEFKPCPFCGSAPFMISDDNHSTAYEIDCQNMECNARPWVWETTDFDAVAAWNTRAPDPEITRLRADLAVASDVISAFIDETVDYMTRNNLGDPEKQHNVKWGRDTLSKLKVNQ